MLSLSGKSALITGGSRGIGLAIARLFAAKGARCTLVGRDIETLETAKSSLPVETNEHGTDGPGNHAVLKFDVADEAGWKQAAKQPWDILVNAAGISQATHLYSTHPDAIDDIISTNLTGTIFGCRAVIPKMMRQRGGCIINVSSLLAVQGGKGASVYAASKAGIVGLTKSLAWEVGRWNIRVNVLLPGYIDTDMIKPFKGELAGKIPLGRTGHVDEVADAAAFLAKNPYAHNCVLNLDGGLGARID